MPFDYPHISFVAILAAAVAQFVLGFVWYSGVTPIGRRWAAEMGMGGEPGRPGAEMAVFPASAIVAAWAVAMVFAWSEATGVVAGVLVGWTVGFAVAAQLVASMIASPRRSMMLAAINVGYLAVGYGLMGAIVATLS